MAGTSAAKEAGKLYLFQRSSGWCIPKFDRAFNGFERWLLKTFPFIYDLDRARIFWLIEFLASGKTAAAIMSSGMGPVRIRRGATSR